jgi:hypothetical protein
MGHLIPGALARALALALVFGSLYFISKIKYQLRMSPPQVRLRAKVDLLDATHFRYKDIVIPKILTSTTAFIAYMARHYTYNLASNQLFRKSTPIRGT